MDVHDISKEILEDKYMTFDDIEVLMQVLSVKRKRIAAAQPLCVGDRIRLRNIKPKYLEGAMGTILGQANTKVKVRLDEQHGRFAQEVRVPRTALEKVNG